MNTWVRWTVAGAALTGLYLGWIWLDRHSAAKAWVRRAVSSTVPAEYMGDGVRIVQFYSGAAGIVEGETTVLCYGVLNATAVRVEPPVAQLGPSFNRCIQVSPDTTTRYTLYATGNDGATVEASVQLHVTPDPALHPAIVKVWTKWVKPDRFGLNAHCLCFQSRNTAQVSVEPHAFAPFGGVTGCFYVIPKVTTTYTFIGKDKKGREARKTYTVEVPGRAGTAGPSMAVASALLQL